MLAQSDNTTDQAHNSLVGQYLAPLVAACKFHTCTLNCLTVGHTHEDVDLVFGVLLAKGIQSHRIPCPPELAIIVTFETAEWDATRMRYATVPRCR